MVTEIGLKEVHKGILANTIILLDVRGASELHFGMLPGAHHLPLEEVEDALGLLPKIFQKKYRFAKFSKKDCLVFYCRTGHRSKIAAHIAASKGFYAKNYLGSIWEWSKIDPSVKRYGPSPAYF